MVVLILERVPSGLRGELSRWMIEPRAGVFIGNISGLVRDKLWAKVQEDLNETENGGALLLHSARTEQGYAIQAYGDPSRTPVDWEGLLLIRIPEPPERAPRRSRVSETDKTASPSSL